MIGPYEVIILLILCGVPLVIILGALGIVKWTRRSDSASLGNPDLAVASLVVGIFCLVAWLQPLFGFPLSVVGLILGNRSKNSSRRRMAIAGIVMSAVGLLATVIYGSLNLILNYD